MSWAVPLTLLRVEQHDLLGIWDAYCRLAGSSGPSLELPPIYLGLEGFGGQALSDAQLESSHDPLAQANRSSRFSLARRDQFLMYDRWAGSPLAK